MQRGMHTAAQPDGKRDQQQACQRKPDNRISHVIVGQMHLKRPGFRDAARKHWSLQIDVERSSTPSPVVLTTLVTLQTAHHESTSPRFASTQRNHASWPLSTDFCNKICTKQTR